MVCWAFQPIQQNSMLQILTDNMPVYTEYLLYITCYGHGISSTCSASSRSSNNLTGLLEQICHRSWEWSLKSSIKPTSHCGGNPSIDLFAIRDDMKCPTFVPRRPESGIITRLLLYSVGLRSHAFPLIPLIPRLVCGIKQGAAALILIAKYWQRPISLTALLQMLIQPPLLLLDIISQNHGQILHPDLNSIHLTTWMLAGGVPQIVCSLYIQEILLWNRELAVKKTYSSKWKRFSTWAFQHNRDQLKAPVLKILSWILHLKPSGHSFSFIKVYLAVISTCHHSIQSCSSSLWSPVSPFLKEPLHA